MILRTQKTSRRIRERNCWRVLRGALLAGCCAAPGWLPSAFAETAPAEQFKTLSQYGITWTFSESVRVGRFVNGDFYVVGPVTITSIDPKPLVGTEVPASEVAEAERKRVKDGRFVRNGSMLNLPARQEVGFDTGLPNYFNLKLLAVPPLEMKPGDSLVSTISLRVGERDHFPYHGGDGDSREQHDNSPTKTAAVLTCVSEPQPVDAFRPAYADRHQQIYLARNLRRNLLLRLRPPPNTPDVSTWIRVFQRPWINPCFFGFEQPMENMPHYGQWVGQAQGMAGLLLMLDLKPAQKEQLMVNVVQVGIDYWGLVKNGHPGWQGWGGHASGRKFPIVFAGLLLGDEAMAAPTKTFPKVEFGEDNQTMYGQGWTGAKALFAGHSGIQSASGKAERPEWGPYEHLPPAKWSKGNCTSEGYRRANTSHCWVGQALVLRMLHAERYWNHDAFFDYVDRWMTEDDTEACRAITRQWPEFQFDEKSRWNHQGYAWEPFVKTMWDRYHNQVKQPGR